MSDSEPSLTESIGVENASILAAAYDQAVSILSFGDRLYVPSRAARLDMIRAMLAFGNKTGFDKDRLTLAALAAARAEVEPGQPPASERRRTRPRVRIVPVG